MTFVFRQVVLLRNNYVMSQELQENRIFNPLTIFSLTENLFNTILQIFLHRLMVKVYFGLVCPWHVIGLDRPRSRDFRHFDPS